MIVIGKGVNGEPCLMVDCGCQNAEVKEVLVMFHKCRDRNYEFTVFELGGYFKACLLKLDKSKPQLVNIEWLPNDSCLGIMHHIDIDFDCNEIVNEQVILALRKYGLSLGEQKFKGGLTVMASTRLLDIVSAMDSSGGNPANSNPIK